MDDDIHKSGLYKWKRQPPKSSSRVYSRSQNCKTQDDIQDWIKKVEQASDKATEAVFGLNHYSGRERGKYAALQTRQQVQEHDSALSEAQDLLSNWMQEKLQVDDDGDEDDPWHQRAVQAEVKREWDHLLDNSVNDWQLDVTPRSKIKIPNRDPYSTLNYSDDEDAVGMILSNMMQKPVVREEFLNDLGLGEEEQRKKHDPRIKMELRHKQVKENREKRERDLEKKWREQQEKKDSFHKAKQMVIQEERDRDLKVRREEQELKKEMARIRKEMLEERHKQQEQRDRERRAREELAQEAREELARQTEQERCQQQQHQQAKEARQRTMYDRLHKFQIKQSSKSLKCLQRHFSAWYKVVLDRRLQTGKARALADWKLLLRAWNAWRSYSRTRRLDVETRQFQQTVLDMHRKQQLAEQHHHLTLLHRYLTVWQTYVRAEQDRRHLLAEQKNTRNKMMELLDAAATGRLWSEREAEDSRRNEGDTGRKKKGDRIPNSEMVVEDLEDFFKQPTRDHQGPTQSGPVSTRSDSSLASNKSRPNRIPTQAWQVTRRHVNLTDEEIACLAGGDMEQNSQHSDTKIRRRFGKQPWMNTHYVVNNFEHRYTSQQKMLHNQHKQIKEQRRMIEELQFNQKQQLHQEEVARQQLIQQHLAKQGLSPLSDQQRGTEPQLMNNLTHVSQPQTQFVSQQRNNVSKEKDTNIVMETARTDSTGHSAVTARTGVSSLPTDRTSTSGSTAKSSTKYLQVLKNMEDRAEERKRLKADRDARRKKEEEERLVLLEAQEEEMKKQAEEEKKARAAAFREKKRLEKQREVEKQHQTGRMRELTQQAEAHYTRSIMKYRGIRPLQKLVLIAQAHQQQAISHHREHLMRKVVVSWWGHTAAVMEEKNQLADEMNSFLAVKRCFTRWKMYKHRLVIEMEKARRFREGRLLHTIMDTWADYATEEKFATWERERVAKEHYIWNLKKRMFKVWTSLPEERRKEVEREKRRNEMRKKVAHLLPDFEGLLKASSELQ
ncbi:coiled-coil domain-containing protein 191-like [Haliotis cracherodii]|uniref:coiled-coil domain-containing protein 191-like n=1 Tax=Haliotis cracherodii TaxID=6455 RepID=UPI0039E7FDCB